MVRSAKFHRDLPIRSDSHRKFSEIKTWPFCPRSRPFRSELILNQTFGSVWRIGLESWLENIGLGKSMRSSLEARKDAPSMAAYSKTTQNFDSYNLGLLWGCLDICGRLTVGFGLSGRLGQIHQIVSTVKPNSLLLVSPFGVFSGNCGISPEQIPISSC